jgi:hypothetical protein
MKEQLVLERRQLDRLVCHSDSMGFEIDGELAGSEIWNRGLRRRKLRTAQHRFDMGHQGERAERLNEVVVGPGAQALDLVELVARRR